ncbi:hypothetical protein NQ317_016649 [Molorchus minor]|uniref:Uncharacterized protein n=1 Tax=Molorchus minor TaxID=1323400 RepID=A0ABQ9JNZ7_9CUCU|nr:hypothetical protein NQ317_016649 [Molorchus minor]
MIRHSQEYMKRALPSAFRMLSYVPLPMHDKSILVFVLNGSRISQNSEACLDIHHGQWRVLHGYGSLKLEVLRYAERLANPVWNKQIKSHLLHYKQREPQVFKDACTFSESLLIDCMNFQKDFRMRRKSTAPLKEDASIGSPPSEAERKRNIASDLKTGVYVLLILIYNVNFQIDADGRPKFLLNIPADLELCVSSMKYKVAV